PPRSGLRRVPALVHALESTGGVRGGGWIPGAARDGHRIGRFGGGCPARSADRRLRPDHRLDERPDRLRPYAARHPPLPHPVSAGAESSLPRLRFPHPLILLVLCVLAAAILTWV